MNAQPLRMRGVIEGGYVFVDYDIDLPFHCKVYAQIVPAVLGDANDKPELRTAAFAIVSAGPNGVVGDEDLSFLRTELKLSADTPEATVRKKAAEDNIVEIGQ